MRWKNKDTKKIINNRRYNRLPDKEKKDWQQYDENKVLHGDILNTIGGGLLEDDKNQDDD